MVLPTKWLLLAPLLVTSISTAQPQLPSRQRRDRRVSLPTTSEEPVPEVRVAAGNLTTLVFNAPLDRDTLEVDRTRFKLADTGERSLNLEPAAELGAGERLVVKVRFKDRALPAQAVIALVANASEMDGKVEVDRRANTSEALLVALRQKEAEVEELKARCAGSGPLSLALSGWLSEKLKPIDFTPVVAPGDSSGLKVLKSIGYAGAFSALVVISVRNLPGQKPLALGQARLTGPAGAPVTVLSVQMKQDPLAPGEEGLVVVEAKTPPWTEDGKVFSIELVDATGQRRLSFNLKTK